MFHKSLMNLTKNKLEKKSATYIRISRESSLIYNWNQRGAKCNLTKSQELKTNNIILLKKGMHVDKSLEEVIKCNFFLITYT